MCGPFPGGKRTLSARVLTFDDARTYKDGRERMTKLEQSERKGERKREAKFVLGISNRSDKQSPREGCNVCSQWASVCVCVCLCVGEK